MEMYESEPAVAYPHRLGPESIICATIIHAHPTTSGKNMRAGPINSLNVLIALSYLGSRPLAKSSSTDPELQFTM